jgi:hypothetical protein
MITNGLMLSKLTQNKMMSKMKKTKNLVDGILIKKVMNKSMRIIMNY